MMSLETGPSRNRLQELRRDLPLNKTAESAAFVELLELKYERAKEELVMAPLDKIQLVQGEARAHREVIKIMLGRADQ